jgi:hypothetical protein
VNPYVKQLLALSCPFIHLSTWNNSVSFGWIFIVLFVILYLIDLIHYVLWLIVKDFMSLE